LSHDVKVREARIDDLPTIALLEQEAFKDDAYSDMTLRQFLDLGGPLFRVASFDDVIVGYGVILRGVRADPCFVSMAVRHDWRHQGVGQELMEKTLIEYDELGYSAMWLTVDPRNTAAIKLATGFGFRDTGTVRDYFGKDKDRIKMIRPGPAR
jgi:ribosomal protein S18 acetylase RimI-like enzyme